MRKKSQKLQSQKAQKINTQNHKNEYAKRKKDK